MLTALGLTGVLLGSLALRRRSRIAGRGARPPHRGAPSRRPRPHRPIRPDLPLGRHGPRGGGEGRPLAQAAQPHAVGVPGSREEDVRLGRQDVLLLRARRPAGDPARAVRLPRPSRHAALRARRHPLDLRRGAGDGPGRAPAAAAHAAQGRARDRARSTSTWTRRTAFARSRSWTRRATGASSCSTTSARTSAWTIGSSGSRSHAASRSITG